MEDKMTMLKALNLLCFLGTALTAPLLVYLYLETGELGFLTASIVLGFGACVYGRVVRDDWRRG